MVGGAAFDVGMHELVAKSHESQQNIFFLFNIKSYSMHDDHDAF